jgi:hypothetical protein
MHPPLAANVEETQSSAAPDAVPIEIEVAALIREARESRLLGLELPPTVLTLADEAID